MFSFYIMDVYIYVYIMAVPETGSLSYCLNRISESKYGSSCKASYDRECVRNIRFGNFPFSAIISLNISLLFRPAKTTCPVNNSYNTVPIENISIALSSIHAQGSRAK